MSPKGRNRCSLEINKQGDPVFQNISQGVEVFKRQYTIYVAWLKPYVDRSPEKGFLDMNRWGRNLWAIERMKIKVAAEVLGLTRDEELQIQEEAGYAELNRRMTKTKKS